MISQLLTNLYISSTLIYSPITSPSVEEMIKSINPQGVRYAPIIYKVARKHNLPPEVLISIISVESSFIHNKVSKTGDIGLAQVNPQVWSREFKRRNIPFHPEKLKDPSYNIETMGKILSIIRKNDNDPIWYALYHSGTEINKVFYAHKVYSRYLKIKEIKPPILQLTAN